MGMDDSELLTMIEIDAIGKATDNYESSIAGGMIEEESHDKSEQGKLYGKLKVVELEIEAVSSTVKQANALAKIGAQAYSNDNDPNISEEWDRRNNSGGFGQPVSNDQTTLHLALAEDRIQSLRRIKEQLVKELSGSPDLSGPHLEKLLQNSTKGHSGPGKKVKQICKPIAHKKQQKRAESFSDDVDFELELDAASAGFVETERDALVRKGILTPFHKLKGFERPLEGPRASSRDMCERDEKQSDVDSDSIARASQAFSDAANARPTTKLLDPEALPKPEAPSCPFQRLKTPLKVLQSPNKDERKKILKRKSKRPLPAKKWRKCILQEENDDVRASSKATTIHREARLADHEDAVIGESPFVMLEGGLKIPEAIFRGLFDYQKVGVQWLWELHCQRAGGIIGDEMGLGKTIQVLSFLAALHFSSMYKPSIVICPVTLLLQWRREARKWYPNFHVELLHDSAHDLPLPQMQEQVMSDESEDSPGSDHEKISHRNMKRWKSLISRVLSSDSGLLITTYEQLRLLGDVLLGIQWGYAILDEGHRIRNPNAEVTLVCKQLQTVHRVIMTGAPIQNKLTELWSLFDFIFPGKLGVLPVFEAEFSVPISVGGYANASPLQVSTAYRCAVVLRDLIMPYLLRRMKADVNVQLPKKTEHVLFCSLTSEQRSVYRAFLASTEVEQILEGSRNSLYGIDVMRKICNHPDLLERECCSWDVDYGNPDRSGKLKVVAQVLRVWREQGHRVLIFSQTQQVLDILENFLVSNAYTYRRMDGLTPAKQRMALMDEFNNSSEVFVFVLTTRVGGVGTNLTGANRIIIFDPDWNPTNDMQARERAWRIGQKREVIVYRLITRGTIEEKVYQRQIFKHFLTNKVLKNPRQRRLFKSRDMRDLFSLNDGDECLSTETSSIFSQLSEDVNIVGLQEEKPNEKGDTQGEKGANGAELDCGNNSKARTSRRRGKERADHSNCGVDEETDVLKSLFDAHEIHSAVNHDVIMDMHDEQKVKLEEEAARVAQKAAEALKQSRMLCRRDSISVPTWTGRTGTAGAPLSGRRRFGSVKNNALLRKHSGESPDGKRSSLNGLPAGASAGRALSSAELVARIRGNEESAVRAGLELSNNSFSVQPEIIIRQICTFIQQRGGRTDSTSIVGHFKDKVPSGDLPLFKNLLKEIATLEDVALNGKLWILKSEYQQP